MSKADSLRRLQKLQLNTIDFKEPRSMKALHQISLMPAPHGFSIRTERGAEFSCPYHAHLKGNELIGRGNDLLTQRYKLIVYPTINMADCELKGMAVHFADEFLARKGKTLIEYSKGPGNVRDVEQGKDKKIQRIYLMEDTPEDQQHGAWKALRFTMTRFFRKVPEIVEWSWYKYPVGRKIHNLIFWEIRPWK